MRDVVVIGGGPAGSTVARLLAEQGHDVVVLEEHETVGTPVHCTGLLGDEAFDEYDLPRHVILGVASSARFWAGDGGSVLVESDRVRATVIDRVAFDQTLSDRAVRAGAQLLAGCRAEAVSVEPHRVTVTTSGLAVHARACVLACGASYRFHRALGLGLPRAYLQSTQLDAPFPLAAQIEVTFGRQVAPKGFAWLVPFQRNGESRARIGLMCDRDGRRHFEAFTRSLCVNQGLEWQHLTSPRQKLLPLGPVMKTYASRIVAVGDAAGLVKPTTGGGIYYGIISGTLAADVLDDGLRSDRLDPSSLKRYETLWRKRLGADIRIGLAFRRLAERFDDRAISSVIELARVNGVVPLLKETASFNWHRQAAVALLNHSGFRKVLVRALVA